MKMQSWKLFAVPVAVLGVGSPMLASCNALSEIAKDPSKLAEAAECCPEFEKGDFSGIQIDAKLRGLLEASAKFDKVASEMEVGVIDSCAELGKALKMKDDELKAEAKDGDGAKKVCGAVAAKLDAFMKANVEAGIFSSLFDGETSSQYINSATKWDGSVPTDLDGHGKAVNLLPGESVEVPNLGRPNANYDPFFLSMLKQIGPALEIPFEVLVKHFSSSYSASRAALLDFWRIVRVRRDFMATNFCEPIKELWFEEAVALGRIQAPGFFSDARIRQAYTRVAWIGDSPGCIDPEKEVNAARKRINLGISTREKESIAYDGGDWEANHTQLAKDHSMRKGADLAKDVAKIIPQSPKNMDIE